MESETLNETNDTTRRTNKSLSPKDSLSVNTIAADVVSSKYQTTNKWTFFVSSLLHEWIIILLFLGGSIIIESNIFKPHQQQIPSTAQTSYLSFEYKKARISTAELVLFSGLPCIILFCINTLILKFCDKKFKLSIAITNFHLMVRSMVFSQSFAWFSSNLLKYAIGRPRPNWLKSQVDGNERNEAYTDSIESTTESLLSFPSSHASVAFALLFQLSLYLYVVHSFVMTRQFHKLNTYQQPKSTPNYNLSPWSCKNPYSYYCHSLFYKLRFCPLLTLILSGVPIYGATYIALTRVIDYQHFYDDILAGIMIGIFAASVSFHHYKKYMVFSIEEMTETAGNTCTGIEIGVSVCRSSSIGSKEYCTED